MEKISIKLTILNIFWASVFASLWISQEAFYWLWFLIFLDYLSWIQKNKKDIRSDKMKNGLFSKLLILLIPLSIWIVWKINWLDMSSFLAWSFALLSFAELYSIVANIYQVLTWEKVTEYDAVTFSIKFILRKIKNILDKLTNTK